MIEACPESRKNIVESSQVPSDQLEKFFNPRNVAVIGASRNPQKPGRVILENFLNPKFRGKVYPVNPNAEKIAGLKCYANLSEIPAELDFVVVAVPAEKVPPVIQECVNCGVKAVVVISGGFKETGERGKKLEEKIAQIITGSDTRVLGPNCIGIYDAHSGVDTLFYPPHRLPRPSAGKISFISQSGAYGGALLGWAATRGIGISKFISCGNMVDVNEIELLEYLGNDPTTQTILMYLEQTTDGRKLIEAARTIVREKPIIALKAGRTTEGARAALSHTGAIAGVDQIYSVAFKEAGIIRANLSEELFDFAFALSLQPPAQGNRIAIITNGGGFGVLATDYAVYHKLQLAELQLDTIAELKKRLPQRASVENPIDLTGDASVADYEIALNMALSDPNVDAVLAIILFQFPAINLGIVETIEHAAKKYEKPVVVCTAGGGFAEDCKKMLKSKNIPCYSDPNRAVRAMAALASRGAYLRKHGARVRVP